GRKYQVETLLGGLGVIDFDGDGWPDLFCVNGAALPSLAKTGQEYWNRLFRNNRDGTFSDVTEKAGLAGQGYGVGVAVGDYNNDGHEDLFVVGVHGNRLYRNNGDGTFTEMIAKDGFPEVLGKGMGVAMADFLGDARPGLFVANDNARNLLFRSTGDGFQEMATESGVAYNGDGRNISGMGADFGDVDG